MRHYVDYRINNMIDSKLAFHKLELKHYFKNRHLGLAGIDSDQVFGLALGAVRDLRVWREMEYRSQFFIKMCFYNKIKR